MAKTAYEQFRELLDRGAASEAAEHAERELLEVQGQSEFWLTQLALALTRAGHVEAALEAAERALSLAPLNLFALLARADALRAAERTEAALADYQEVLGRNETRVVNRGQRGVLECLSELQRWQELLNRLAEWDWQSPAAMRWRVKALAGLQRTEEAITACHQWLDAQPDNPQALWELTHIEVERDGVEAVRKRMGRLAKVPSRPLVYREIYASLCRRAGKPQDAVGQYEKIAGDAPTPRILRKKAFALAKSGQEREAIPMMEELLRLDPQDFYVHSAYEGACARTGDLERAWNFYNDLLARHPEHKGLYGRMRRITKRLEKT